MQAGTQIAMRSCSRRGFFQKGRAALFFSFFKYTWFVVIIFLLLVPFSLRDPVDQGLGLAGGCHAVARGALGGGTLVFLGACSVLLEEEEKMHHFTGRTAPEKQCTASGVLMTT